MARFRKVPTRWAAAALVLGICALLVLLLPRGRASARADFEAAQSRWAAQSLADYRLVVEEQAGPAVCIQDLQIENGQIRHVYENSCKRPPFWTGARLFDWIAQLEQPDSPCYPSAPICICRVFESTNAVYDPQIGIPYLIEYTWQMQPNLLNGAYWRDAFQMKRLPRCQGQYSSQDVRVTVLSLVPSSKEE